MTFTPGDQVHVITREGTLRDGQISASGYRKLGEDVEGEWAVVFRGRHRDTGEHDAWIPSSRIRPVRPRMPWCCWLDPVTGYQCALLASWRVVWEPGDRPVHGSTDACHRHLAALLPGLPAYVWPLEEASAVDHLAHLA